MTDRPAPSDGWHSLQRTTLPVLITLRMFITGRNTPAFTKLVNPAELQLIATSAAALGIKHDGKMYRVADSHFTTIPGGSVDFILVEAT